MLGMLKSTGKVFTLGTTSVDLAKALATIVEKPKEESLKRYIDEGSSDYRSPLSRWTTQYVMEQLGSMQERLFVEVAYKQKQ
jgi:mannose-1-phosphate guanylyltransferase